MSVGIDDIMEYKDVNIKIERYRWHAFITITDKAGYRLAKYVTSADPFFTKGDGLWFGTMREFEEWDDTLGPQYWAKKFKEQGEKA